MKEGIQKEVIHDILADYQSALENILYSLKSTYEKHNKDFPKNQKEVLVYRMKKYFETLKTIKQKITLVSIAIEDEDRNEISQLCKTVIQLTEFIREDSKELVHFLNTGSFPKSIEKDSLH